MTYSFNRNILLRTFPISDSDIVFLGDSETQKFELYELLKNEHVRNRGIDGDKTMGVLNRLPDILNGKPRAIFIDIGINDILFNVPATISLRNMALIIKLIKQRSPNTKIILESIFPCSNVNSESIIRYNKGLKNLSISERIDFIDLYPLFETNQSLSPEYDCGDRLHLNGKGYLRWASILNPYLKRLN